MWGEREGKNDRKSDVGKCADAVDIWDSGYSGERLYGFRYNLRKKVGFRKLYVRKCTEKSYSIFNKSVLY